MAIDKGAVVGRQSLSEDQQLELAEWIDSIDYVIAQGDPERVRRVLSELAQRCHQAGIPLPHCANTPYINTIPASEQVPFPGSRETERRVKSIIRWNAMAMVVRANREESGIGGHISSYASEATLYEVGFNHFFRGSTEDQLGDDVFFQGHASPGNYARAFLEGRLSVEELKNFRHEWHASGPGLPSYPHPWSRPDFWQFATVSMGLGPLQAIYRARFDKYLQDRGLVDTGNRRIWAFVGDGETDEPETLGAISLAGREHLNNLIFVVNCNLQRLDGPVRGNGNVIQELETVFQGAGWNVIKVIWGTDMDHLLAQDEDGRLMRKLSSIVDGEHQNFIVKGGNYIREHLFGGDPKLRQMVEHLSDEELKRIRLGGHDPEKVYAAYKAATEHTEGPTVILARTVKGYGLGEAGEGMNITHQQKKLNEKELREFRSRFGIPISEEQIDDVPFYRPPEDSPEMVYLQERRKELGGYLPSRTEQAEPLPPLDETIFEEFYGGSEDREVATTMAFGRMLTKMLKDKNVGSRIVPIIPDEARTFGLEALFRQIGIYSHAGQLYEPVDSDNLLYYREARDGQLIEEGITEAGALSSFIAAGTAYSTHRINMIPVFMFYSMFGLQRVGDLVWAAGDMRARGFLVGGTAGRTTLAGEGLQHCDGNSHLLAYPHPTLKAYDPAFAYEIAMIVQEGFQRMFVNQESLFYYITIMNEGYVQPAMPDGVREGIINGIYRFREPLEDATTPPKVHLFGSGAVMNCALQAQRILHQSYGVAADVWSVTSYKELHCDALNADRWSMLNPTQERRKPYLQEALGDAQGVFVAATDYVRALPESIAKWVPGRLHSLGTDGFGRSDGREHLRQYFEVDERYITAAALRGLVDEGEFDAKRAEKALKDLEIDPEKVNPLTS